MGIGFRGREIAAAFERNDDRPVPSRAKLGKVLAFMGAKGGAGTTTLALSAADLMSRQGSSVVAVDLSPSGAGFADHLRQPAVAVRLDASADRVTREAVIAALQPVTPRLRVLTAAPRPGTSAAVHALETERLLQLVSTLADHVIVDVPSRPCEASRAVVQAADAAVLVVEPAARSVQAARAAAELIATWGARPESFGAVLVERSDRASELPVSELLRSVPVRIVGRVPFLPEACRYAHAHGLTLFSALANRPDERPLTWVTNALIASAETDSTSVLLVDERGDAEDVLGLLREHDAGRFHVARASTIGDFVAVAAGGHIDVVVLCDSAAAPFRLETLAHLRVAASRVPIVVLTSNDLEDVRHRCLRLGAHECIPRARVSSYWLGWALRACIDQYRKLVRLQERNRALEEAQSGYRKLVGSLLREGGTDPRMV